jgi:WD40 repeat protein
MDTIVPNNPYVGPRSIKTGEPFFGRDKEIRSLSALLAAERIVMLHSPSGAGKSSLIQAGLMPRMTERFSVFPLVRVNLEPPEEVLSVTGLNRYVLSALLSLEEGLPAEKRLSLPELATLSLDAYLEKRDLPDATLENSLLLFDQFEEVLTVSPTDASVKQAFFEQLGEALQNRRRWALFAIREDYIGGLAPYVRAIPNRLAVTFRLGLLGPDAAKIAIQQPAKNAGVIFTDHAAETLVSDLCRIQVQRPDGSFVPEIGLNVEPVQLQVVCYNLWQSRNANDSMIGKSHLRRIGSVDQSLSLYYANSIKGVTRNAGIDERILRRWFNERLITPGGIRSQVLKGADVTDGLPNIILSLLEDTHLIRGETRAGKTWYELSHDRLVRPVRQDNAAWFEKNLNLLQRQSVLWNQQGRSEGLLLRGKALEDAEKGLSAIRLTADEQAFLDACRVLRKREQRERKRNTLMTFLAIGATIAMMIAGIFYIRAQNSASEAQIAAVTAQAASTEAIAQKGIAQVAQKIADTQKQNAIEAAKIARAGELAAQSVALRSKDFPVSLLLGIESFNKDDNTHTRGAMLDNVQANPRLLEYIAGHNSNVTDVAFSPNGQFLASAGCRNYDEQNNCIQGEIKIWNANEHKLLDQPLINHKNIVSSLAFSPDGKILASGSMDESIILWDTQSYRPIGQPFTEHQGNVTYIRFTPDGHTIVSVSCKHHDDYSGCTLGEIILWDVQSRQVINRLLTNQVDSDVVALSPDGKILALARQNGSIVLWDLQNQEIVGNLVPRKRVFSMTFSPDGKILASTSCEIGKIGFCIQGEIFLWDTSNYQLIGQPLLGHTDYITDLVFNSTGTVLITSGWDSTIMLWDMKTYQPLGSPLTGHYFAITSIATSPDGKFLASGSWDKTVIIWDIQSFQPSSNADLATGMAFSPDGNILASGNGNTTITLRDTRTHQIIGPSLTGHHYGVNSVAFSPDSQILASGSCGSYGQNNTCVQGEILLWNVQNHQMIGEPLINHGDIVTSVSFSPDGKILASGSQDKTIILWDVGTQQPIGEPLTGHNGTVSSVAFSPDGQILASGSCKRYDENNYCLQGEIMLWDVQSHQAIHSSLTNHKDRVDGIAFSPNGKMMASGSWDKTVTLWDTETWQPIGEPLTGHLDYVFSVAFSPDNKVLASGSGDKTIILWDLRTRRPIGQPLAGHSYGVLSLAFSPDGKTLYSGSLDNAIALWDIDPQSWLKKTCQRVGRNFTLEEWARYFPDDTYRATCPEWPLETGSPATPTP